MCYVPCTYADEPAPPVVLAAAWPAAAIPERSGWWRVVVVVVVVAVYKTAISSSSDSWRHYRCLSPPSSLTALAHTGTHALTVKLYTYICSRGVEHRPLSRGLASFYSSSVHLSPTAGVSGMVSAGVHSHQPSHTTDFTCLRQPWHVKRVHAFMMTQLQLATTVKAGKQTWVTMGETRCLLPTGRHQTTQSKQGKPSQLCTAKTLSSGGHSAAVSIAVFLANLLRETKETEDQCGPDRCLDTRGFVEL